MEKDTHMGARPSTDAVPDSCTMISLMIIVYEVHQGISEYGQYCVMIVHSQGGPKCPLTIEGPELSILRQCIFEALFE